MDNNEKKPEKRPVRKTDKKPGSRPAGNPERRPQGNPEKKTAPGEGAKKKKASEKVLKQRRLIAIAAIALVVLILIILIAKGCSNGGTTDDTGTEPEPMTSSEITTIMTTTEEVTTTVETTTNPLAANVKLDRRELFVTIGEYPPQFARIEQYPDDQTGENNEVWKSEDESIATVDDYGYITGVKEGETFIVLSFDNHPDIQIEIKVHVAGGNNAVISPDYSQDGEDDDDGENQGDFEDYGDDSQNNDYQDGGAMTPSYGNGE